MKKTMSFIMSFSLICGANIANASAADFINPVYEDSESYQKQISEWNTKATHAPELTKDFSDLCNGDIIDMWVNDNINDGIIYVIYQRPDLYSVSIAKDTTDSSEEIEKYLSAQLGSNTELTVTNEPNDEFIIIDIEFNGKDHELNYLLCDKALSIVSRKYNVVSSTAFINRRFFGEYHISWDACTVNENNFSDFNEKQISDLNKAFTDNNIKAQYDPDSEKIVFSSDITAKEHLEYASFIKDNYDQKVSMQGLVSAQNEYSQNLELKTDDLKYLSSDANCDGNVDMSDAVLIMQSIANPSKYKLTAQGNVNADTDGDGITSGDALAIQKKLLKLD